MKIHQYRAKALLADYAIPVPRGSVAAAFARAGRIAQIPARFQSDSDIDAVVLIGEVGGVFEQEAARFI